MYTIKSKIGLARVLWFQHQPTFSASMTFEIVYQVRTKERKTRSISCMVNLNCLHSCRPLDCDIKLGVIVSLLNERVHFPKNIRKKTDKDKIPDSKILINVAGFFQFEKLAFSQYGFSYTDGCEISERATCRCLYRISCSVKMLWKGRVYDGLARGMQIY